MLRPLNGTIILLVAILISGCQTNSMWSDTTQYPDMQTNENGHRYVVLNPIPGIGEYDDLAPSKIPLSIAITMKGYWAQQSHPYLNLFFYSDKSKSLERGMAGVFTDAKFVDSRDEAAGFDIFARQEIKVEPNTGNANVVTTVFNNRTSLVIDEFSFFVPPETLNPNETYAQARARTERFYDNEMRELAENFFKIRGTLLASVADSKESIVVNCLEEERTLLGNFTMIKNEGIKTCKASKSMAKTLNNFSDLYRRCPEIDPNGSKSDKLKQNIASAERLTRTICNK